MTKRELLQEIQRRIEFLAKSLPKKISNNNQKHLDLRDQWIELVELRDQLIGFDPTTFVNWR